MNQYIQDTCYCTTQLFKLIYDEQQVLTNLQAKEQGLSKKFSILNEAFMASQNSEDTNDVQLQATYHKVGDTYKELTKLRQEIACIQVSLQTKEFSIQSLSGAILQVAKQGISTTYSGLSLCPPGRTIGQETLKNIIWQARNQTIHFEESTFSNAVTTCFTNLISNFGNSFNLTMNPKNKAYEVLKTVLGWTDYNKYEADMMLLLK